MEHNQIGVTPTIRKRKCEVAWFTDREGLDRWVCKNHLSTYGFKEGKTHCWYASCPGRRVPEKPLVQISKSKICANYGCSKPVASSRKKYCSDKCRKQKARKDYETRNPNRRNK